MARRIYSGVFAVILKANTGIVVVFGAFYFGVLGRLRADQGSPLRGGVLPSTIQEDR